MPLARVRALGHELAIFVSEELLTVDFAVRNPVWSWFYSRVVRPLVAIPRSLFARPAPITDAPTGKPKTTFNSKSLIEVESDAPDEAKQLAQQASQIEWYHTFDLGHGIVTPGAFDHSPILHHYRLPDSLAGRSVLDVACFDGFWAMEFERRGADRVVALDIDEAKELDLPPVVRQKMTEEELHRKMGDGFRLVHRAKNSRVERVHCNVYDLSPDSLGSFDIVHIGDVFLHLQNPFKALANVARVTQGYALISDVFDPRLDRLGNHPILEFRGGIEDCVWWYFSFEGLEKMIWDAGFKKVELLARFKYGMRGNRQQMWHAVFKASM
jgi:tRNA (mo5U34)-methyltransferase